MSGDSEAPRNLRTNPWGQTYNWGQKRSKTFCLFKITLLVYPGFENNDLLYKTKIFSLEN